MTLTMAGGDEKTAIQRFEWAQNREFQGKEVLFAKMGRSVDLLVAYEKAGAGRTMTAEQIEHIRDASREYVKHRTTFDTLPPRTQVDPPDDPMRPVPNLAALNASAKAQLTPEFVADMRARGYVYENTSTLTTVRHVETDGNVIKGGYFAGGLIGPWGPQGTPAGLDAASALVPEIKKIAPYIGLIVTSPTDRTLVTDRRATQGVLFPEGTVRLVSRKAAEHGIGGFCGLKKCVPDRASRNSGLVGMQVLVTKDGKQIYQFEGIQIGFTEDGKLGVNKNNLPRSYVPPEKGVYLSIPRVIPVTTDGAAESWDQMGVRISELLQEDIFPAMAQGKNVLAFTHQYVNGFIDGSIYKEEFGRGVGNDPLETGHKTPNTAPQYVTLHMFRGADGKRMAVPAIAGQSQLAAPGKTPKGQTPPANPISEAPVR